MTPAAAEAAELLLKIGDLQIPSGTVVHGDAVAVGGTLEVEGTVEGQAAAIGGNIEVGGRVMGSVRAVGGNVTVRPAAVVGGTVSAEGGQVHIAPGASVGGAPARPAPPLPVPHASPAPPWWWPPVFLAVIAGFKALLWIAILILLAVFVSTTWLVAVLFPRATMSLAEALERAPWAALGAGVLGWVLLGLLATLLAVSVVGLPLLFLMPAALFVALQFGMTAIALLVGRRIHPSGIGLEVIIGTAALAIGFLIPNLGWLLGAAVGTWGLGVVVLALLERGRGRHVLPPTPGAQGIG